MSVSSFCWLKMSIDFDGKLNAVGVSIRFPTQMNRPEVDTRSNANILSATEVIGRAGPSALISVWDRNISSHCIIKS